MVYFSNKAWWGRAGRDKRRIFNTRKRGNGAHGTLGLALYFGEGSSQLVGVCALLKTLCIRSLISKPMLL